MTLWMQLGSGYEFEYDEHGFTGWYRCIGGRLADGRWPQWNSAGQERFG